MKTQQLILILFFGLALFTGCQNEETKHNILFISIDDLKPSINSYGDSKMLTPNIDKLAKKGVIFKISPHFIFYYETQKNQYFRKSR